MQFTVYEFLQILVLLASQHEGQLKLNKIWHLFLCAYVEISLNQCTKYIYK